MQKEIRSLTGMRGIAALLVMFYHFNAGKLFDGHLATFMGHGYMMVDLFFILSGFVIAMTYGHWFEQGLNWGDYLRFLARRVARIYPLYVLMSLLAGLLIASNLMDRWSTIPVPISAIVNLTMLQSLVGVPSLDAPGWSISAEWIASLAFPLLAFASLRQSWPRVLLLAAIALATLPILTVLPALANQPKRNGLMDIWHYSTVFPVVRCLAGFTLGVVSYRLSNARALQAITGQTWYTPTLVLAILALMCVKQADLWIVSLFPLLILGLSHDRGPLERLAGSAPIYRLGVLSYGIYLIHNLLNYFMLDVAEKLSQMGLASETASASATLLFGAIAVGFAELTYRYIERPARNGIRRVTVPQLAPSAS